MNVRHLPLVEFYSLDVKIARSRKCNLEIVNDPKIIHHVGRLRALPEGVASWIYALSLLSSARYFLVTGSRRLLMRLYDSRQHGDRDVIVPSLHRHSRPRSHTPQLIKHTTRDSRAAVSVITRLYGCPCNREPSNTPWLLASHA